VLPGPRDAQGEELEMKAMTKRFVRFLIREDGPTAVEYAVMLALIIVVCVTAIGSLGSQANATFGATGAKAAAS
jgi:pilus assembly protein Flp/PilA